jgi:uncharacterized Zn finger protein
MANNANMKATHHIDPKSLVDIVCEACGGRFFKEVSAFKRLPALLSPTAKEQIIPVPTFRCDDCGHVNEEFMPI